MRDYYRKGAAKKKMFLFHVGRTLRRTGCTDFLQFSVNTIFLYIYRELEVIISVSFFRKVHQYFKDVYQIYIKNIYFCQK